jgi:sulfite reductase (ferredoxin)
LVILDVPEKKVEQLITSLAELGLQVRPSTFRRSTMACTGIEFCKLAVTETKQRATNLVDELEARLPDFEDYARININGCPNACARFQVADIGFMGSVVNVGGAALEIYNVHLGGHLGEHARFGRMAKGARVRADRMADYIESLLRLYLEKRLPEQDFTTYLNALDDEALQKFARDAMPEGALVEAGSTTGNVAQFVREPEADR